MPNLWNDNQFCPFRARADRGQSLGAADGDSAGAANDDGVLGGTVYRNYRAAGPSAVEFHSSAILFVAAADFWRGGLGVEDLDSCDWARWVGVIHREFR